MASIDSVNMPTPAAHSNHIETHWFPDMGCNSTNKSYGKLPRFTKKHNCSRPAICGQLLCYLFNWAKCDLITVVHILMLHGLHWYNTELSLNGYFKYTSISDTYNSYALVEQGLTSPPTQYRLSGRQFYRSKDPTNSIKVLKEQKNTHFTPNNTKTIQ